MKNKKGFTLIELLAVIVILGVILVIATTNVIKSISTSREKAKYTAAKEIGNIAEAYMATETDGVFKINNEKCVDINTLIEKEYLEKDVTNPTTGENGGNFEGQMVCTSSKKSQDGYEPSDGSYKFDGYEYILENESKEDLLGDVNGDGIVDEKDVELVQKYDAGTGSLTDDEKKRADVNGDGIIDAGDAVKISNMIIDKNAIFGDVNGDGKVDKDDAELVQKYDAGTGSLTDDEKKRADVNGDGVIDAGDVLKILNMIIDKNAVFGDVNGDGKLTQEDVDLIKNYDAGTGSLTDAEKKRADVNGDGDVDAGDSVMISQLLLKETGDINGDKKIDEEDALLILKHDSGISSLTNEQKKRADLNNDGVVDAGDAVIILRIINNNK